MNLFKCRVVLALTVCLWGVSSHGEDWPHWRGVHRTDISNEPSGWQAGAWPLKESWRTRVPEGASSPLVVGEHLYTQGWEQDQEHVLCLDAASGKELWRQSYPCPKYGRLATGDEGLYSGPSSTPEYDTQTGYLYSLSTDGDLNCWNTRLQGKRIWSMNLYDVYDVPQRSRVGRSGLRDYGYTSSPLVFGDWLIVEVGARQGSLMAFDKTNGKQVWASQSKASAGHNAGPALITVQGIPCVAVHNFEGLLVARLDPGRAGETVATWPWVTSFANNVAMVTVHEDSVLLTSAYNQNKLARLRVTLQGAELVWEQAAASKVCTPIVHDGNVYWAWQHVTCVDFETGEVKWTGGSCGDAGSCIVTSDQRMLVWAGNGDLSLVDLTNPTSSKYTELASIKGLGQSDAWPHVVLSQGRVYCKDRTGQIVCLTLK